MLEIDMMRKLTSFIGRRYCNILNGRGTCTRKDEIVTLAITSRLRIRKAHMRIVHGKPTPGIKCVTIIGKITLPSDEPAMVKPPAKARLLRK
jgi:hypothetical protein